MTTGEIVALSGVIVSNAVAVGKWWWEAKQRKAAVEKAGAEGTLPEKAPSIKLREFFPFFLAISFSVLLLCMIAFSSGPVTRLSVTLAAFAAATTCSMFLAGLIALAIRIITEQQTQIMRFSVEIQRETFRYLGDLITTGASVNKDWSKLVAERVESLEAKLHPVPPQPAPTKRGKKPAK